MKACEEHWHDAIARPRVDAATAILQSLTSNFEDLSKEQNASRRSSPLSSGRGLFISWTKIRRAQRSSHAEEDANATAHEFAQVVLCHVEGYNVAVS